MPSNTRWVILSFGVVAMLVVYLGNKMTEGVLGLAGINDPLAGFIVPLPTIIGLLAGAVAFAVLMRHTKANDFGLDVVKEAKKVTWPTILETRAATVVVIILVFIISIILGLFDWFFSTMTNLIYS